MGATILTGKHAAAFKRADGTPIYALFERTYEANCYPHYPRWHCRAIGGFEEVLFAITRAMNSCESQGLQARSSMISPESLLKHWYQRLAKPTLLPDHIIKVGGAGDHALSGTGLAGAIAALNGMHRPELAAQLETGSLSLSLYANIDVVLSLFGVGAPLPAWLALQFAEVCTLPVEGFQLPVLAPAASSAAVLNPVYEVRLADQHHVLVREAGKTWRCWGYHYSAVQRFMERHCLKMEKVKRLSCVPAIKRFRELCEGAEALPADTLIELHKPGFAMAEHIVRTFYKVAEHVGAPSESSVSISIGDAGAAGLLTSIFYLPGEYLTWHVAEPEPTAQDVGQCARLDQSQQLELLV